VRKLILEQVKHKLGFTGTLEVLNSEGFDAQLQLKASLFRRKRGSDMSVEIGIPAPDFEGQSTKGKIRLSSFKGKRVVLYFYPKAFTPGCSRETQRFAEMYEKFRELNAEVIGISADKLPTQEKFFQKYNVNFPLVADPELNIIRAYGVLSDSGKSASRVTLIIDENGIVRAVIKGLKKAEEHVDKALEVLKSI